jgi:hypothetical protein
LYEGDGREMMVFYFSEMNDEVKEKVTNGAQG